MKSYEGIQVHHFTTDVLIILCLPAQPLTRDLL